MPDVTSEKQAPDITMVILTPTYETYKSLHRRVKSLADDEHITPGFEHAFTKDQLDAKLQALKPQNLPVCLYCDITDGKDKPPDLQRYLTDVWNGMWKDSKGPDDWLLQRPLIITSAYNHIVLELQRVQRAHRREHSTVIHLLASEGTNRWRDVADALREGIRNA